MFGKKKQQTKIGAWTGLIGLSLAVVGAFLNTTGNMAILFNTLPPLLGIVAGWLLAKDIDTKFLLTILVLLVAGSSLSSVAFVGDLLVKIFKSIALFFASMMVVPILKYVWDLMTKNI